jgi:DNA-directed RNA polymerase sigma subunit (sigma70/sigma32)
LDDSLSGQKGEYMEHGLSRSQVIFLADEWILNARDNAIVKKKLLDGGITYEQIAEEENLSVQRIKEIVSKGKKVIFSHANAN